MTETEQRRQGSFYSNPELYDLIFGFRRLDREVGFVQRVFEEHWDRPPGSLLDLACGTGGHVVEAARKGIRAVGMDLSPDMVDYAARKAKDAGVSASFMVADMAQIPLRSTFEVAICMFQSLPLLTQNEQLTRHFEGVANCLADRGLYIIEMGNPMHVLTDIPTSKREIWEERCWTEFRDGARIRGTSYRDPLDPLTETLGVEMVVDVARPGVSTRVSDTEVHRLLLPRSLEHIAWSAGKFRLKSVYADFSPASHFVGARRSPRMICCLEKERSRKYTRERQAPSAGQLGLSLDP